MSASTVLARKWRPRQFADVIGQAPVVAALSQALTSGRLHHAYLFTGTRGVGKTTLARIFAKALNCRAGHTAQPCDDDIAQAIDAGNFVDLIEIDAASRTKVEDTRELLDNIHYAPSVGRYKIYIIDEVHMLSTHSFNALLKTLEEPPEHVKFLLATTDPHKLPVTVLSRCLQFHLKPMTAPVLQAHLAKVLTAEGVQFEQEAIEMIVRMSGGSVRDSLSLLDQAIMLGAGAVNADSTREMLGLASDGQLNELLHHLVQQDEAAVLLSLQQWVAWGADFDRLQQQLLEKLHQLALLQSFVALQQDADAELQALAQHASSEQVQIWLQVALLAQEDMRLAPTAQMGFELMLMRLMHFIAHPLNRPQLQGQPQPIAQPVVAHREQPVQPQHNNAAVSKPLSQPAASAGLAPHLAALAAVGSYQTAGEKKTVDTEPATEQSITSNTAQPRAETDSAVARAEPLTETTTYEPIADVEHTAPVVAESMPSARLAALADALQTVTPPVADSHLESSVTVSSSVDDIAPTDGSITPNSNENTADDAYHDAPSLALFSDDDIAPSAASEAVVAPVSAQTQQAAAAPAVIETAASQAEPTSALVAYSSDAWLQQLDDWRLNGPSLALAMACVRLQQADDGLLHLACAPQERANIAMWGTRLLEDIQRASGQAMRIQWHEGWSESWITPNMATQIQKQANMDAAQAMIEQEPRLQALSSRLGLAPQWSQLVAVATD